MFLSHESVKTCKRLIDDFRVTVAIFCKLWLNLYKMLLSSLRCGTTSVKNLYRFDHQIESQISFLNFIFRRKFLHLCKRIQKQRMTFFMDFHGVMRIRNPSCTPAWKINGVITPKSPICCKRSFSSFFLLCNPW